MKPQSLVRWEQAMDDLRASVPRNCYSCGHAKLEGDKLLFCSQFSETPPDDFAGSDEVCTAWSSVHEAPF